MNTVNLIGRLTHEPELKKTPAGVSVCSFQIAVDRNVKPKEDGTRPTDYIDCVAWRGLAETITKYIGKGRKIAVTGRLQTQRYTDKDGKTRKSVAVVIDSMDFADSRKESQSEGYTYQPGDYYDSGMQYSDTEPYESPYSGFTEIGDDGDLPF